MENSYGIGVTNRYALFLDDDADPLEVLKVQEQEKELKKKSKVAEKENKGKVEVIPKGKLPVQRKPAKETPNNKSQDTKRDEIKSTQQRPANTEIRSERSERNRFPSTTESREERNNKRNRDERTFNGQQPQQQQQLQQHQQEGNRDERPRREYAGGDIENKGRGGRGGMSRPRGARGGRGAMHDQRGKREFDRQSGSDKTHGFSGVKAVDKREGGGPHNWGSHRDVIEEVEKTEPDTTLDMEKLDSSNPTSDLKETSANIVVDPEAPVVEEPKLITLDEWKAQRGNRQKPQYNLRKAGEGEDPSQWKKMYALNKKKEGEEDESDDEGYDAAEYPQRVGRQKHILDINIHFYDNRRGGPGGAGRGRGRGGGGGRSGPRGGRGVGGSTGGGGAVGGGVPVAPGASLGPGNVTRGPEREIRDNAAVPRGVYRPSDTTSVADQGEEPAPRTEHQTKGNRQNAPKVDDEHDFPSLS